MAGLYDLLQNPRRLRQFAQTPGNFPAALSFASQGGMAARPAARARQSTAKEDEEGVLKTGEVIDKVRLPDGTYVRPATESGQLVKAPGKSNLYLDPATGEPYQADPAQPGGIRSAWSSAKRTTREGKEFAVIPGVGERELGPDPKAAEEAAKLTAKREAENRRLAFAREKRPYNIDRITGEPVPLQSDEEWQKQKAAKQAALDQAARVKRLKTEADLLKLDARQIELETPKPAKEDEDAFTAARDALAMIAPGEDADAAAERLANAPDTGDEAALVAKQSAQAYLASREKIRPAQEAAAKVREMSIRALDLEKQALNPDAWKAEKQASLKDMTDDDLMKEATAQAEIITKQESEASDKLNKIVTQRNALVEELNAFQARRQQAESEGLSLNERAALDQQQADMEAAIADYDEWNSEATSEAQASLKAAADRREVLQTAGSEIESRNAVRAQTAEQAQARATMLEKGRSIYETWGKGLYMDDWRDQPDDDARFQQEAKKAGLSLPEAKEALQTFRQLDWSNIKRDPKTAEPIEEQARLLPDGNVTVNPANLLDPEAYNAAVDAVDTTPEAKERAKAMRAELAAPVAEEAYNNLRKNADFAEWLDENTSGTPLERMEKFNTEMKAGGALNAALMKFLGSTAGLPSGWLGAVAGITGSDKAMEYANWWKDRAQAYGTAAGEASKGTNMAGRFMASVAGGLPSVMESLAVGGVAGRVLGSGAAALGAAAVDAAAQSGGNTFLDATNAYIQQGLTPEEAKAKAATPAIASGLVTAVLTAIGGGGVESLLRTEGQALAKAAIKRGIAAQVGEGVADEAVEEWADQMLQGVVAQLSYDPNKSLEQVFTEATEAGLVGGVLGGGASGLRAFMDRNVPTEGGQPYTPEAPAPEGGPAPTMPTQPRPAGQENVSKIIAAFKPTGTPMPQAVNDTIKRTGRAPDQVAQAAASGLVKVAQGASLESLDAREREALGFVNKDGKIVPAPKTTPIVEIYKDKLVIRNEAAEWLDDEGQPVLARQIKLDEAERKAQIDEAAAKPAKKKAGQAKEKAAESTPQAGLPAKSVGSLPTEGGSIPPPATISGATEAPKPSQTITGSNAEMAAEMPVPTVAPVTSGEAPPAPAPQAAPASQLVVTSSEQGLLYEQSEAGQRTTTTPETTAHANDLANTLQDGDIVESEGSRFRVVESKLGARTLELINDNGEELGITLSLASPERKNGKGTIIPARGNSSKVLNVIERGKIIRASKNKQAETVEQSQAAPEPEPAAGGGLTPAQVAKATPEPTLTPAQADQMARAKAAYESAMRLANADPSPDVREKLKKAAGMKYAAAKRQITGKLTGKEAEAKAKREASNYEGKAVSVKGRNAVVTGTAFGKVKVKFDDGTTATVPASEVQPPIEAKLEPAVDDNWQKKATYDQLVAATYAGQEANRKFNDLTLNNRRTVEAFAKSGLPSTDANIEKVLESIGITGAVDSEISAVKKNLPIYRKIEQWKQAEAELSQRRTGQETAAKEQAKEAKKAAKQQPASPEVTVGEWIVDANGSMGPVIGFENGVPVIGMEGENEGDVEPYTVVAPWTKEPTPASAKPAAVDEAAQEAATSPAAEAQAGPAAVKPPEQMSPEEFQAAAKFGKLGGKGAFMVQIGNQIRAFPHQKGGKLTKEPADILKELHQQQIGERFEMLRSDRADAAEGSVASTKNIAKKRLESGKAYSVNAAAVDAYGIALPEGYVREGDLYVYRPEASEPAPARQEQASQPPASQETASQPEAQPATPLARAQESEVSQREDSYKGLPLSQSDKSTVISQTVRDAIQSGKPFIASAETLDAVESAGMLPEGWTSIPNPNRAGVKDQYLVGPVNAEQIRRFRVANNLEQPSPLERAQAALAAYQAKAVEAKKAATSQKDKNTANRQIVGAKHLAEQLAKLEGAVEYEIATAFKGASIPSMMVIPAGKGGVLAINPAGLLDSITNNNLDAKAITKAIDKFIVHELIHKAALGRLSDARLLDLYNALTPAAKEASRKLYLAQAGENPPPLDEFQAAHEWFAQLVEARMTGEISNQALIEASDDATFRDKLVALLRDFVAQLRDISGLVKDKAMAEQIRAEADAVQAAAEAMAAKAGLQVKAEEAGQAAPSQPAAQQADPTLWADVSRFFASMNSDSARSAAIKDLKNGTASDDAKGYLIDLLENPNWTGNARSIAPKLIARLKSTMGQPSAQAQPEPSPAQAVPTAGEADDTQVVADALKRHFGTKVETTKMRPGVFKAGRLVYGLYDAGKLTEKQVINGIPVGDNQVLLRMEEEEAQPTPAEAPALPAAEPYASPLAQFVGEWLGMNASQQSRVDMPQRVIRLAVNQADTEAVMALIQEAGTKGADGQLLFNTPHQRIYNELREALRYTLRKGMGTEKDKVSTQLTAVPAAAEAPALPPTQAAAVAKEEAMPEPAKQVAPFDAAAAKGQKKFLLAEAAAAVKAAPRRSEMTQAQKDTISLLESLPSALDEASTKAEAENLRLRLAATKADAERLIGYITIEVPGDGTFTILNEKGALAQFQKRADKLPVSAIRDDMPAKPTAQAPTAVPALKKPKTTADVVAAIYPMVSDSTIRGEAITKVNGDGTHLFATDGRVLVRVEQENGGGKGREIALYDEKGVARPAPENERLPDIQAVIPNDKDFTPYTLDTGRWFSLMSQARAVLKDLPGEGDSGSKSASLYRNQDGSLGVFASDVNRGDYAHNIQPEAKFLASYNPEYVQTILRVARNLGQEQVEMRIQDDITPATFRAGPALFVLMPMRVNGAPAYSPQAQAARPVPPVTAQPEAEAKPAEPKSLALRTQDDTQYKGKTPQELLEIAAPYEQTGQNYNRNIAESAARLRRALEMDRKFWQLNADELAVRLERWAEPPAQPEAPASQEPAQATGPASIGQENVNAKHSREWSEVSTEPTMSNPRGSLKTDAIRSKTPSAPWYYQGDIRQLAFNQKVIEGGKSAATPEGAQTLKEYSAAVKDGWSYTSVRAGSYGTVYVFRKDKQVLTNAGAAALTSEAMARPEGVPESRGGNETNTVSRLAQYSAKLMEWLQTLPESTLNSSVALSTKMRNDVLAKWVRLREPDYKPYEWQLQYLKPDGKPDVQFFAPSLEELIKKAINYAVIYRDMPAADRDRGYGYPEFKDAPTVAETLAANGFAQPAEPSASETTPSKTIQPITGFESARAFIGKLREGQVTAEQVRTAWAQLKAARPAILADLNKMKVDDLLPMAGISARKADGKAAIAKNVLNTLDMYFNPDDSISYSYGGDFQANKDAAMDEKVVKWTDEIIQKQAADRREAIEARRKQAEEFEAAKQKALTNPETKEEWDRYTYSKGFQSLSDDEKKVILKLKSRSDRIAAVIRKGESLLTPEQLAAYDAVRGIDRKAAEQARTEAQARVYGVTTGVEADIVETKHTQKGHDLFVVKLSERVERPVYDRLNAAAKKLGGYYSSYSKGGAVPGFQFTSRAAAENFIAVSKGETVDQKEQIQERREAKKSATASRLNALADGLDAKAEGILNADRKTNTAKRAREAAGQEANARKMQAMAQTMRNLAAAMESGEATHLDGVTAGTHVDTLDGMARSAMQSWANSKNLTYSERQKAEAEGPTAEMMDAARIPYPYIDKSTILGMVEAGRKTPGAKLLAERVAKIQMNEDDGQAVTLRRDDDLENVKELAQKVSERGRTFWDGIKWKYETYDRLKAMGLTNLPSLRAALREYLQYRGKAAKADPVKAMERELIGMKLPGFFPTPRPIIDEMIGLAGIRPGMKVLEPSAGKGDIAQAAQEAGAEVDAIELSSRLRDILQAKGINVVDNDFTTREPSAEYDAVVMNPPFENGQDIEHVQHAYKFLKEGGTLVAVMSAGPFYRQDKQATAFREWLDEQNSTYEAMPEGSFAGTDAFRQTGVRTYLVTIRKPYSSMPKMADEGQAGPGLAMPLIKEAENPIIGKKLPKGWVYHNIASKDIPILEQEGMSAGSFTDNPGFQFGRDAWVAVRLSDLRAPSRHQYGKVEAIEPLWGSGLGEVDGKYIKYDDEHIIPPNRIAVVNKRGVVERVLGTRQTLAMPPADQSADLEAAARAAMGEAEAGQPATEAEDLAKTARLMDEQQKQAEAEAKAREELRNDPANIAAVEATGAMAGRNLSKQFTDPAARSFYQALTAAREMLGGPETVVFEEVRKWAARQLESDPAGAIAYATELADNKTIPGVEGQAVLAAVIEALNREVAMTGDKGQRLLLTRLGNYYLDLGTTLAQTLGFRRDPLETPQDRWNKALRVVFGPAEKVRRRLRLAPTEAAKARRIAELEAQIANYQGSRRADIEAALAEAKRQETQESIIAKEDAKNEKLKGQILGRMGLTERDLTLSPVDRYALQTAILDLPEVSKALNNYPDGRDIMRQAMRGFSDEHIANSLGLNQDDVAKFIKDATNAIIRPAVKAEVKANRGFGDMVKSGLQSLARKVGLRMAAVSGPLGTMSPPLTAAELAKVEQEVNDILNFALQPAARRNKAGNLISKVIDTPGGKKVRVFVPFDPDDAASFYAFAREFSTAKSNVFDKLYEYWINWPLLGGPQTQVANITGNAAQLAWHYTGQRLAEAALNVAYRDPNSAQLSEFKHIATAFFRSMGPALDMARQSFLTEGDTVRHKYLNEPMEIEFKDGSLDKLGAYRPAIGGKAGRIARLPGRLLRFTDAFFKTAILHTEAAALAYRKAHAAAKAQGLTGANRAAFIDAEMANDMNNPGSDVWTKAMGTAEELLFQDENAATDLVDAMLGGHRAVRDLEKLKAEAESKGDYEAAARISNRIFWRSVWGKIMRLIFPFQRTPTNIIKAGLRKAGGAALSGAWHATRAGLLRYKEGKPFIESYTKAMQIKDLSESLLAGLGWLMLSSAFEGDDDDEKRPILIVGNRPYSPGKTGEREAFMRETGGANAILFRDKDGKTIGTFNFSRYEPVATLLSAWVDGYRNFREVNRRRSQGEPDASYLTYIGSSLFASVEGKSFLQGVSGLMETLRSFEERREPSTSNWAAKQLINAVVPNIIKQPLRNWDDLVRDTKNAGIGYIALPNPEVAPKLPAFQAEPKITTTGERIQKGYTAPARLLFAANAKVTPQPDALLLRANRLNPTKAWFPQPLQKDDFYVRTPGAKPGTPGYKTPIADPAKKRQFAELSGKFYAQAARQIEAATPPAVKAKPTPALIEAYKKAREQANARARAVGGIMGLHK